MVDVRPARLDRPLRRLALDPAYTDPHLEEMIRGAADRARSEAHAQGYAAGWSQGRQAANERAAGEIEQARRQTEAEQAQTRRSATALLTSLGQAVGAARTAAVPTWSEVADTLAEAAVHLAEAVVGRELRSVDGATLDALRTALNHLAEPGEAVVHLSPADAALLVAGTEEGATGVGARVVADPTLTAGSVVALTPAQRLEHDLPAALEAARAVLRA